MPTEQPKDGTPKSDKFKIKVTKNGPYAVTGGVPLSDQYISVNDNGDTEGWQEGKKYPLQESYALCRCGHSTDKPFCNGNHEKVGFKGKETASRAPFMDDVDMTEGPTLRLADKRPLCAVARFCERDAGVWDLTEMSGDPVARDKAIRETFDCPSGRLVIADRKTNMVMEPVLERSIGIVEDPQAGVRGPIWVRGGILIESADGKVYEVRNRVTLCRCGRSSNKPFCDATHMDG